MLTTHLYRYNYEDSHTLGVFVVKQTVFFTIERAWADNYPNVSCIPTGEYEVDFLPRSGSGKYRNCYHIKGVPKRSGILIHNGNLASHSKGCIILGTKPGKLGSNVAVLNSKSAMRQLNSLVGTDHFKLRIW